MNEGLLEYLILTMRSTLKLLVKIKKPKVFLQRPSPVSLGDLLDFGRKRNERDSFIFLKDEIPVRLSHILREFKDLPPELQGMKSVRCVTEWYYQSYNELQLYKNEDPENNQTLTEFSDNIEKILSRHAHVVETMAQGVIEMEDTYGIDNKLKDNLQYFLDRFYMNRISIRMLLTQHALLFGNRLHNPNHIGNIDPECDVQRCVEIAYGNAKVLCDQNYLRSPDMETVSANHNDKEPVIKFVYVPSHLEHILFEVLKNAMRAVVEYHESLDSDELPKLKMTISKGKHDLTIRLSDQGGGVPCNCKDKLFQYMYSTAPRPDVAGRDQSPLAGYGYGLPLSRLYARYFQGDLQVNSMEGYGTDVYIYLKVNSADANECLPVYNSTTSKIYGSERVVSDWSTPSNWTHSQRTFCTISHNPNKPSRKLISGV